MPGARRGAAALATLALGPLAWVVLHVTRHTVQVPVHDQWQVQVPVAIRAAAGDLRPHDLLAPYLEHRYLLTRALTAINARLFGWDLRVDAWVNVLLVLATLLLLVGVMRRQRGDAAPPAALLFSALLFSPRQRWTWGLMSSFLGVVLLLALALWTLTRRPPSWPRLLVAAALATLATFSAGPGVALWPALAVAAWLRGYRRPGHAAVWAGAFVLALGAFSIGYHPRPPGGAGPAALARYALAFLGGPLVPESARFMPLAAALGALGLGLVAASLWMLRHEAGDPAPAAPWLGLCVFSVGAAALAAVARAPLLHAVPFQPLRGRYVSLAVPFWVGLTALVLLATTAASGPERRRVLARSALLLALALAPCYLLASAAAVRAPIRPTAAHERCLRDFPLSRDATCLADVVYGPRAIQPRIDDLARLRLAAFRRDRPGRLSLEKPRVGDEDISKHLRPAPRPAAETARLPE